ncbi:MAG: YggS family pyridoxal phosphate-dependent enzyme [Dehalococcoidia bacterium]|nr:YggS family pyridoxal phosphate-dependent enzyme [Dehalococcoidia bacterium]
MVDIQENIRRVEERIAQACHRAGRSPSEVTLIVVTKTVTPPAIYQAFAAGLRNFGENRVQEAQPKLQELADLPDFSRDLTTWHMVGHLQTNKVKAAIELFNVIHSVDSLKLAQALDRNARVPLPVLVQVNMAGEATKSGFPPAEARAAVETVGRLPNLKLSGLMTIAPIVANPEETRPVFRQLHLLCVGLGLPELSMGMTDDFEVAIEEGATMVRIGRAIFGERPVEGR